MPCPVKGIWRGRLRDRAHGFLYPHGPFEEPPQRHAHGHAHHPEPEVQPARRRNGAGRPSRPSSTENDAKAHTPAKVGTTSAAVGHHDGAPGRVIAQGAGRGCRRATPTMARPAPQEAAAIHGGTRPSCTSLGGRRPVAQPPEPPEDQAQVQHRGAHDSWSWTSASSRPGPHIYTRHGDQPNPIVVTNERMIDERHGRATRCQRG